MRCAIYARYSSENQSETSIDDQVRQCRKLTDAQGWTVVATFKDAATSGASTTNRDGYKALVAGAREADFDIVRSEALDRLSRDQEDIAGLYKRLSFLGVKLVTLSEGEINELHVGLKGTMNALYLKDLAAKTWRGLEGKAKSGLNAGGRRYGYKSRPVYSTTEKDNFGRPAVKAVRLEVDPEEAEVVRQIFTWYADGLSPRGIVKELNRRSVPSPTGKLWAASALNAGHGRGWGMLSNEIYIGRRIWNRTKWIKNPDTGKRTCRVRPESEWIVADAPDLRIINQDLWDRVQARRKEQHDATEAIRNLKGPKANTGRGPKFLLSGILKCGVCGGSYSIHDAYRYACTTNANRGDCGCPNRVRVPRRVAEQKLLAAIKEDLFSEEGIALFKKEVRKLLAERQSSRKQDTRQLRADLARVATELDNIMTAIRQGIITPTTKSVLQECEAEKQRLERVLNLRSEALDGVETMLPRALDRFADLVENLESVALREVTRARNQIKALVGGEIRLCPTPEGGLNAQLQGDYAGLIELAKQSPGAKRAEAKKSLVAGEGLEPPTRGL